MKYIYLLFFFLFLSCGREAELKTAPKSYNEQLVSLQAFNASLGQMENQVRAFTLLFYPRPEQIASFAYNPDDLAQGPWNTFLATIPYADRVVQTYEVNWDPEFKVQKMVAALQSVGRSRDEAWRKMEPLDRRMSEINDEKSVLNTRIEELEPNLEWRDFTCFYAKRPRRGKKYDCRISRNGDYKRRSVPRGCDDLLEFEFTFESAEQEEPFRNAMAKCEAVYPEIKKLEDKIQNLNGEFDSLYEDFEPLEFIRKSGESVALDILQAAERHTLAENNPQVFIATGSSKEKPNNQDILSEVEINWKEMKIEKMSLFIEFGLNYSGGTQSQEYSIANGRIKNVSLATVAGNPTAKFEIHTDDFWIDCALDITNDDPAMGYRMVGEVFAHFSDGSLTRGGMKLEFNMR